MSGTPHQLKLSSGCLLEIGVVSNCLARKYRLISRTAVVDESLVVEVNETSSTTSRVEAALKCLPPIPVRTEDKNDYPYLYWTIRDYAEAYKSRQISPSEVSNPPFIRTCTSA